MSPENCWIPCITSAAKARPAARARSGPKVFKHERWSCGAPTLEERQAAVDEGRFQAVAEGLKQTNPEVWGQITDTMKVIDTVMDDEQSKVIVRGLTKGSATQGMEIARRLSLPTYDENGNMLMSPEQKIQYLAALPPAQLETILEQSRTFIELENSISKRLSAQYAAQGRRHTRAPEPFRPPKGGANAPVSLERLASRGESAADYVKARKAMEKRGRDE